MSSKQWTVGYFERENKYSVIPDSWLISCGNMRICRWPKTGNISEMISEYTEYGNDWPTYPVKIISQYYDFTLSIFPETNKSEIEKAMRMKLNNFNKKKSGPLTATTTT